MFLLFMPLVIISIILSIIFSLHAYTNRSHTSFIVGTIFCALSGIQLLFKFEMIVFYVQTMDLMMITFLCAWIGSIVFLILSKSSKKPNTDDGLTDSFLDSIINDQSDDNEYTVK